MTDTEKIKKFKVKKCLKCSTETDPNDENEFFCSQCGAPVLNKCSNYNCLEILDENAKFCKYCGSASTFNNFGLFETSTLINYTDELPF